MHRIGLINALMYFFQVHIANFGRIFKLARYNVHQQTLRTSLGFGWIIIRDFVYYLVFIMFRYLMSGSQEVDGTNFILYLMVGIIAWNFMSEAINGVAMTVKQNNNMLSTIQFPVIILPTVGVIGVFIKRSFSYLVLIVVTIIFGDLADVNWLLFFYYNIAMFALMLVWSLIFSSMIAISNDFNQLYLAVASVLFYTVPVIWSYDNIASNVFIARIFKLNPFSYIIEGFRDAIYSGTMLDKEYTIYFWIFITVAFVIGAVLQNKLKNYYIDMV